MIWIYIAAAIFGGGFIIPALIGDLDFDTDIDIDFDVDTDLGGAGFELDADLDAGSAGDTAAALAEVIGGAGDWLASLLTFRTFVFVSAFFGTAGIVFTWLDYPGLVTLLSALSLGTIAGIVNARLMAYLRRTANSGELSEHHLRGSIARVILPVGDQRRGRVELDVAGQPLFMVAVPYRDGREDLLNGEHVVVVEVKQGTAYVTAAPELGGGT